MSQLLLFLVSVLCVLCELNAKNTNKSCDGGDPGQPLYLTPYIEDGELKEARDLSRVEFPGFPDLRSYSGLLTVDSTYDSNQFFWYFPAKTYVKEQVVILWLQGGPGVSSLYGLFQENGPLEVKNGTFKQRQTHWALHYHVIYIDNPVGVGYSSTNDTRGYCTNETQVGEQLYSSLIQFFKLFPELQPFKFIITGESYAGKYIPALAYTIHKKNPSAELKINLQGLAIGNGFCDPINQLSYGKYLYELGFIDWHQRKRMEEVENETVELITMEQWKYAAKNLAILLELLSEFIGQVSLYNIIQTTSADYSHVPLIKANYIKKAIHVGSLPYVNYSMTVDEMLREDMMQSMAPWISELLSHYKVLFFNGQLDIIVAYTLTIDFLKKLEFSSSEEYKTAKRQILKWMNPKINEMDQIGYMKRAGNLTEVLIRNAGHMVPADQPEWILQVLNTWLLGFKNLQVTSNHSLICDTFANHV